MTHDKPSIDNAVVIGRHYWDVPVRVKLEAYLSFSHGMDLQLRRLTIRWAHAASPKARGIPDAFSNLRRSR